MKNHRRRMKTRLGTRTGKKTLKKESKRHPNVKERSESKGQFSTFGVSNSTLKGWISMYWALAQQPSSDDNAFPFQPFHKRVHPDSNPNHPYIFFRALWPQYIEIEPHNLAHFFYVLRGKCFEALKLLIFIVPLWDLLLKLGFLDFKDNWISFFGP